MDRKILLVLPLLAATAACNTGASNGPSLDMMAQAPAPASFVATRATPPRATDVDNALARLPEGAGAIHAVRERNYPNGTSQDIALESDAPGALSHVAVAIQSGRALASREKVPVWKPGEAGVKEELAREFPGLPMRVVVNGGYENRYGRFGVAIGRDGDSLRCIYAWQYIEDARRAFGHGQRIQLSGQASADQTAPAALRVKLCRADSTVDELVAHVKALVVDIPESYASAPPVALRIPAERAPRVHAARAHYARRAPRTEPDPAPGVYPAPPGYVATPVAQPAYAPAYGGQFQPPQVQPGQVPSPVAPGGPRYLAPVSGGAGGGMATSAGLNPSLPPQAYRGPGAARAPADPGAPGAQNSWQNPYQRVSARAGDAAGAPPQASTPPRSSSDGAPRVIPLAAAQ